MSRMVDLDAVSKEWDEEEETTAEELLETALDNCLEAMGEVEGDTLCKLSNVEMAIKELYEIWDIDLPSWAE